MKIFENRQRLLLLLLLLISVVSLVLFLGSSLFNTKGEPREAIVALSMLKSGDWVSPVNNGVDIAYKPPFFHWCIALCSLAAGRVTEFTARFPSAFFTILMVLSAYIFMLKNRVDCKLAFLASVVTITTFEVHRAAMACRVDMVLSALTVMSILAFQRWYVTKCRWLVPVIVLLISGAFLTKGPVGALLPCMVIGVYMLLKGENFFKALGISMMYVLLSCILPFLWYYSAYMERGKSFLYLVYEENVLRFMGKMVYSSHEEPAIYNVATLLLGFLPYTLLVVMSFFVLNIKKVSNIKGFGLTGIWNKIKGMTDMDLICFLSSVLIFIFYCIPKSKRSVYLLPVYPFLAYFLAKYIMWLCCNHKRILILYGYILSFIALLLPALFFMIKIGSVPHNVFRGKHAAENISYLVSLETTSMGVSVLFAIGVVLFGVCLFIRWSRRDCGWHCILSLVGIVFSINIMLDGVVLPRVFEVKSDFHMANEISRIVPEDNIIWDYRGSWYPGERNRIHQFSLNFYLEDRVVPLDLNRPKSGYMIMGDEDETVFMKRYAEYRLFKIKRFSHRSCDDKRNLTLYKFVANQK